jgi:hypothetical protein
MTIPERHFNQRSEDAMKDFCRYVRATNGEVVMMSGRMKEWEDQEISQSSRGRTLWKYSRSWQSKPICILHQLAASVSETIVHL